MMGVSKRKTLKKGPASLRHLPAFHGKDAPCPEDTAA